MKIDIGGGKNCKKDFECLDIINDADYYCNLEKDNFPFEDESVDEFYSSHTFEHIENIIHVFNEVWRNLKWGGKIEIRVPHKDCTLAWQDPTHKRYWTEESFKYFCGEYLKKYKLDYGIKCCFKIQSIDVFTGESSKGPKYFTEIKAVLLKDKEHYEKVGYPYIAEEKDKQINRKEQFESKMKELLDIFLEKNNDYGDGYFSGGYSDVERWMSIKRKVTRLNTFYEKGELSGKSETIEDTWKDLAIYCIMELMKRDGDKK